MGDSTSFRDCQLADGTQIIAVMVCSTTHISAQDLSRASTLGAQDEYGVWVYAWYEPVPPAFSLAFAACLHRAQRMGCRYVRFDCDGPRYNDLEGYPW